MIQGHRGVTLSLELALAKMTGRWAKHHAGEKPEKCLMTHVSVVNVWFLFRYSIEALCEVTS